MADSSLFQSTTRRHHPPPVRQPKPQQPSKAAKATLNRQGSSNSLSKLRRMSSTGTQQSQQPQQSTLHSPKNSRSLLEEEVIYIPDLTHTGLRSALINGGLGLPIGKNMRNAVGKTYPRDEQRGVKNNALSLDMGSNLNESSGGGGLGSTNPYGTSPSKSRQGFLTSSSQSPVNDSTLRKKVVVNSSDNAYLDKNGDCPPSTRVHDLIYSKRNQLPVPKRRDNEARRIIGGMREDWAAFKRGKGGGEVA
jgi:hypothetical protein